jgi:glycerophosphoryl diester phosphodiesterase
MPDPRESPAYFHGPTIDVLHQRYGLKVIPYTVDDEPTMQRLVTLGVDSLISDDPDLVVLVAQRNGLR